LHFGQRPGTVEMTSGSIGQVQRVPGGALATGDGAWGAWLDGAAADLRRSSGIGSSVI
jgi:hypothetical protein